jgi:hypothetical protein
MPGSLTGLLLACILLQKNPGLPLATHQRYIRPEQGDVHAEEGQNTAEPVTSA